MRIALLLALILAGCATRTALRRPLPPMPKAMAVAKSAAPLPPARTNWTIRWVNCADQPPGVWYRVYERFSLAEPWHFYKDLTNTWSLTIPFTNSTAFYVITAMDGSTQVWVQPFCP